MVNFNIIDSFFKKKAEEKRISEIKKYSSMTKRFVPKRDRKRKKYRRRE